MSVITTDRGAVWTGDSGLSHFDGSISTLGPGALEGNLSTGWQIWTTPFFAGWTLRLKWFHYVVLLKRGQR